MSESKSSSSRKDIEEARDMAMQMTLVERAATMEKMISFRDFDENGILQQNYIPKV